jgi:hypothetical protein
VLKGGNLGHTENFKQAVPDTKGAVMLGYVDFEAAGSLTSQFTDNKDLVALRSAGYVIRSPVTARQTSPSEWSRNNPMEEGPGRLHAAVAGAFSDSDMA